MAHKKIYAICENKCRTQIPVIKILTSSEYVEVSMPSGTVREFDILFPSDIDPDTMVIFGITGRCTISESEKLYALESASCSVDYERGKENYLTVQVPRTANTDMISVAIMGQVL